MKKELVLAGTLLVLGVFGCAHQGPPVAAGPSAPSRPGMEDHLVLHTERTFTEAKVTNNAIEGPAFNIGRDGNQFRGWAYNLPLNVTVDEAKQQVRGVLGQRPLQLNVQADHGVVRTEGLVYGYLTKFTASPRAINGYIGPCGYELVWTGGAYEGTRACKKGIEQMELRIPNTFRSWTPADSMTSLTIFLLGRS